MKTKCILVECKEWGHKEYRHIKGENNMMPYAVEIKKKNNKTIVVLIYGTSRKDAIKQYYKGVIK